MSTEEMVEWLQSMEPEDVKIIAKLRAAEELAKSFEEVLGNYHILTRDDEDQRAYVEVLEYALGAYHLAGADV